MAVSKSSDGKKWEETLPSKDYGYIKAVAIHPRDKKVVFAGGQYSSKIPMSSRFYRSTDAGSIWNEVAELAGKGTCVNGIAIDPAAPNRVLAALDSGVFVSEDAGKTWLAPRQMIPATCIVADPATKGRFFAGSTQGVWVSRDGGKNWSEINENIPSRAIACLAFDQKNSTLFAGGAAGGVMRLKLKPPQVSVGRQ